MSNPSSAQELPPESIVVRLSEVTVRMLFVAQYIQGDTRTGVTVNLIRDWLQSSDRKRSIGGRVVGFTPSETSVFDIEKTFRFPIWVRAMLFKATGGDIAMRADVIRVALEEGLPSILGEDALAIHEARIREMEAEDGKILLLMLEAAQSGGDPDAIAREHGWTIESGGTAD